jgi:RNA polymerase sigma factor (sigma-70 family)
MLAWKHSHPLLPRRKPDKGRARFRTWLRTIVHSRIADHYRKKRRDPLAHQSGPSPAVTSDSATSTTHRIPNLNEVELDRLIDGKLEQAIPAQARKAAKEKVRMKHYQAYDLFVVQELKATEVAASLGVSAVTVRVRAFRVRRALNQEAQRIVRLLEKPNRSS